MPAFGLTLYTINQLAGNSSKQPNHDKLDVIKLFLIPNVYQLCVSSLFQGLTHLVADTFCVPEGLAATADSPRSRWALGCFASISGLERGDPKSAQAPANDDLMIVTVTSPLYGSFGHPFSLGYLPIRLIHNLISPTSSDCDSISFTKSGYPERTFRRSTL